MIIWSLFDSGNGCYKTVADRLGYENYSIGLDIENKNDHFIHLNLADYGYIFGDNTLWDTLDTLPAPDLIIASPPCESWSVASAMEGGNACWKQDSINTLFGEMKGGRFTIRKYDDYGKYNPDRAIFTRLNGELTVNNTIRIFRRYKPKVWVIENPAHGRIWEYIEDYAGFKLPHRNQTFYSDYGFSYMKPTGFASNLFKFKPRAGGF